ncbi:class IV adenylate cyclase [Nonomuraea sp. KC401]|uniref:class IV adenylate cyclase n=1 Tax=unclassified Nonomuraea TaxID=2593643 RepID=UPI0010FEFD7B|nr:class IV adenylate cyclase [Nonomuraea sp. KC401]NBE97465.1 class IV adenylate cyclase [Nonomuraea sp. K271]TLF62718.1 class IV adenylate cyclase [Nonomuraea sp. KC401]
MADGTQEVEVKYRVGDTGRLEAALARRGAFLSPPSRQDDQAYAEAGWTYEQSKVGRAFSRLRTQDGRHLFTVKRPIDNEMACLEHETEVADREAMHQAIVAMGFYPTIRIVKVRRWCSIGELTICVDEVEHAGTFMEIERTVRQDESGAVVQAELDAFARGLGVELDRTSDTYDSLVRSALASV